MLRKLIESILNTYKQMEEQRRISRQSKSSYLQTLYDLTTKEKCPQEKQIAQQIIQWHDTNKSKDEKNEIMEGFFKNLADILMYCAYAQLQQISVEYAKKEIKKLNEAFQVSHKSSMPLISYFISSSEQLIKEYEGIIELANKVITQLDSEFKQQSQKLKETAEKTNKDLTEANKYFSSRNRELINENKEKTKEIAELKSEIETLKHSSVALNVKNSILAGNQKNTSQFWSKPG